MKRSDAIVWLADKLASGEPMAVQDIRAEAYTAGITPSVLRRVRDHLQVISRRSGFGPGSSLTWQLPAQELRSIDPAVQDQPPNDPATQGSELEPSAVSEPIPQPEVPQIEVPAWDVAAFMADLGQRGGGLYLGGVNDQILRTGPDDAFNLDTRRAIGQHIAEITAFLRAQRNAALPPWDTGRFLDELRRKGGNLYLAGKADTLCRMGTDHCFDLVTLRTIRERLEEIIEYLRAERDAANEQERES